jgi:hypothetical protein
MTFTLAGLAFLLVFTFIACDFTRVDSEGNNVTPACVHIGRALLAPFAFAMRLLDTRSSFAGDDFAPSYRAPIARACMMSRFDLSDAI